MVGFQLNLIDSVFLLIFNSETHYVTIFRSSTLNPLTSDHRIRVSALSSHETFNAPTAASGIPRLPSGTFLTPSRTPTQRTPTAPRSATVLVVPNENELSPVYFLAVPPPPSYEESLQATPPVYSNLHLSYVNIPCERE